MVKIIKKLKKYGQLSFEERKHRGYLYNKENRGTLRDRGQEMKRSHHTIGFEVKTGWVDGIYEPEIGEKKARLLRKESKRPLLKLLQDGELRKKGEADIREKISPKRISGGLKWEKKVISPKSIYKLYTNIIEKAICALRVKKDRKKVSTEREKQKSWTRSESKTDHREMASLVMTRWISSYQAYLPTHFWWL